MYFILRANIQSCKMLQDMINECVMLNNDGYMFDNNIPVSSCLKYTGDIGPRLMQG